MFGCHNYTATDKRLQCKAICFLNIFSVLHCRDVSILFSKLCMAPKKIKKVKKVVRKTKKTKKTKSKKSRK